MAINFNNSVSLSENSSASFPVIHAPGRIIQTQHKTFTSSMATSQTSAGVDFFYSNSITLSNATNKILIEWFTEARVSDWGDNVWNLYYMQLIYVNTGAQISYTGYNGETTNTIRPYFKVAIHTPGTVGPHVYKLQGWCYPGISSTQTQTVIFNGSGNSGGDAVAHIRLSEVAA